MLHPLNGLKYNKSCIQPMATCEQKVGLNSNQVKLPVGCRRIGWIGGRYAIVRTHFDILYCEGWRLLIWYLVHDGPMSMIDGICIRGSECQRPAEGKKNGTRGRDRRLCYGNPRSYEFLMKVHDAIQVCCGSTSTRTLASPSDHHSNALQ